MSIQVRCQCGQMLDAPAEAAGRKVRCPVCRDAVSVPAPTQRHRKVETQPNTTDSSFDDLTPPPRRRKSKKKKRRQDLDSSETPRLPPKQGSAPGPNVFRPTEESPTASIEKPRRKKRKKPAASSSDPGIMTSLMFPFRTEAMITICVMTFFYTCIMVPLQTVPLVTFFFSPRLVVGVLFLLMLIQGYFWHFLFEVLRMAAYNEDDLPMSADWDAENIFYDLVIAVGATLVSFSPLIAGGFILLLPKISEHPFIATIMIGIGVLYLPMAMIRVISSGHELLPELIDISPLAPLILLALVALPCLYLPMAIMASVLHQSVRAAFPWYVLPAMVRMPWSYLETLVLVVGIGGLTVFLQFLTNYIPYVGVFLVWFLVFTGNTAIMHRLGSMYYENRRALNWFPDGPRVY